MGGGTDEGFLGLANGSRYDGSCVDRRRDGFGTEEREREKAMPANGQTFGEWANLFSPSGELLWKRAAVAFSALQPI